MRYYQKRSKYGNRKITIDNITFDSRHEACRYQELMILQKTGEISDLELQKKYILIPSQYETSTETFKKGAHKGENKRGKCIEKECTYLADFVYRDVTGQLIVEDAKGMKTEVYKIKKKLMLYIHGIRVREV